MIIGDSKHEWEACIKIAGSPSTVCSWLGASSQKILLSLAYYKLCFFMDIKDIVGLFVRCKLFIKQNESQVSEYIEKECYGKIDDGNFLLYNTPYKRYKYSDRVEEYSKALEEAKRREVRSGVAQCIESKSRVYFKESTTRQINIEDLRKLLSSSANS